MAMAVSALVKKQVSRIILTRPAIEAGEKLGFLPGDLQAKVNPYLRPLYDALYDMMEIDRVQRAVDQGAIEVAPLAYMRGRTLNDSFIILDEGQNCTSDQMKMFLTRLGFDSKTVITGDVTQVDLAEGKGTAGMLLKDEDLYKRINDAFTQGSEAFAKLQEIADDVRDGEGLLTKLLMDAQMAQDVKAFTSELARLSTDLEGSTVGKLMASDEVYQQISGALESVQNLVDEYREQSPIITFATAFFGAF